ncbi:hypothetical protein HAX54_053250, partial [Datura stramonium]|nr:hypothetical protein [Datura stramonium]
MVKTCRFQFHYYEPQKYSTKSGLPTLANSKPRQGRPPTKKKEFERLTRVSKPDSCPEESAKYMSSMPSDDIAGILSSTKSGLPTLENSKCRRMALPSEPDSCLEEITKLMPFISSKKEFKKHILHLGWKFQLKMDCGIIKKYFIAPDGK